MEFSLGWTPQQSPIVEATVEDGEPAGQVVVTAVAAVSDDPVMDLPPLYGAVDPDALDDLFHDDATSGYVGFSYDGFLVLVTADGTVEVHEQSS